MENARLGDAGSLLELAAPVAVVGFGLCWAALYIIDYTFIFMPVDTFSTVQRDVGKGSCDPAGIFLCEAAVFLLYGRLSAFNFRLPLAFAAYGLLVVMVAVNALQDVMGLSVWACAASMLAAGMWQGVFHILWAEAFMHFDGKVRRNLYLAVITGAIGFVVATLIAGTALSGMLMVLLLAFLSLLCYLFVHRFLPDGDAPVKSLSKQSAKKLSRSNVVLFCFGMVFGVAIYACMEPDLPVYVSYPLTGLGLGIGVALLLAVDLRSKEDGRVQRPRAPAPPARRRGAHGHHVRARPVEVGFLPGPARLADRLRRRRVLLPVRPDGQAAPRRPSRVSRAAGCSCSAAWWWRAWSACFWPTSSTCPATTPSSCRF